MFLAFKHNKWTKLIEFLQSVKNVWFQSFLPPKQMHASIESTHSRVNYIIHHWRDHHVWVSEVGTPEVESTPWGLFFGDESRGRRNEQPKSRRRHEPWKHCLVNVRALEKIVYLPCTRATNHWSPIPKMIVRLRKNRIRVPCYTSIAKVWDRVRPGPVLTKCRQETVYVVGRQCAEAPLAPRGNGNLVNAIDRSQRWAHCALRIVLFCCFNVGKGQGEDFSPSPSSQAGSNRWPRSQSVTVTTGASIVPGSGARSSLTVIFCPACIDARHATLYPTVQPLPTLKRILSESNGEESSNLWVLHWLVVEPTPLKNGNLPQIVVKNIWVATTQFEYFKVTHSKSSGVLQEINSAVGSLLASGARWFGFRLDSPYERHGYLRVPDPNPKPPGPKPAINH